MDATHILSPELSVYWVTARQGTTWPTTEILKLLAHALYVTPPSDNRIVLTCYQANFRKTNVATKLKVTYVKDTFLDVSLSHTHSFIVIVDCFASRSRSNTKLVSSYSFPISSSSSNITSHQGTTGPIASSLKTSPSLQIPSLASPL